ncbi:CEI_1a_G0030890.mRNA.1.CDS.1 [Saccharomyces cerevisiae]|nr:CEI_1a_G0030890.mRNA.1.CDS.1 [Saccharomyces cerevisiae]CAI7369450.1 CEI_1a_G0030890.mRNA.1.CDS.1 [Saccharomyces cerevisiae]
MSLIAERTGFYDDLYAFVHNPSKVTWGTCAAPVIEEVLDPEHVQVLYKLDGKDNGGQELIVAAKQKNNILATSFHPELAENDIRFHDWFIREFVLKTTVNKRDV